MGSDSRRSIDWEAVHREYRAGQLSVREIARQFDISESGIRRKAKERKWKRDLTHRVREKVRTELVRTEVRSAHSAHKNAHNTKNAHKEPTDDEIVEAAAERAVKMIELHRQDIATQRELIRELQLEIQQTLKRYRKHPLDELPEHIRKISMVERALTLKHLATALSKVIPLERQAFNVDDLKPEEERILVELD